MNQEHYIAKIKKPEKKINKCFQFGRPDLILYERVLPHNIL